MLFALSKKTPGYELAFELQDGTIVEATSGEMLYDASGKSWPSCSILIAPFRRLGQDPEKIDDVAKSYLGRRYKMKQGSVTLPSKDIAGWAKLGDVKYVFYFRRGDVAPGPFYHKIGKRHLFNFWKKRGKATLYRKGAAMRLELGKDCVVNWRGIVSP